VSDIALRRCQRLSAESSVLSRPIVSETLCNGIWLVIDYFTGAIGKVFMLQ
jgi:hypothetical protein